MTMPDDVGVLTAAMSGDRRALDGLLRQIRPQVLALVRRGADDPDEAEDVTQEVLVKVTRSLGRLHTPACFLGWLFRIVQNELHNARRAAQSRRSVQLRLGAMGPPSAITPDPIRILEHRRVRAAVARLVNRLPDDQRDACRLVYVDGLRPTEAAGALGRPHGTVRASLCRGRRTLRLRLAESRFALVEDLRSAAPG